MEAGEHQTATQLPPPHHGDAQVNIFVLFRQCFFYFYLFSRSLASRGELLPIYNKAKEKTMEIEKKKKDKKAAAKV